MMPVEADYKFCANCAMHHWNQPVDKNSLVKCPGCQMIQYCGEACRKEHWSKVHKKHCQFLADPTKCPQSQHDAETCVSCRPAARTGKGKSKMAGRDKKGNPTRSSQECFIKDIYFPPSLSSPHPFPVAGVEDDLLEKSVIVMQILVSKFKHNPRVAMVCSAEMDEMEQFLWSKRGEIWFQKKVHSHPQLMSMDIKSRKTPNLIDKVTAKVIDGKAGKEALENWKIIEVVHIIMGVIEKYRSQDALKNPVESIPEQIRDLVKLSLDNKFEILDNAQDILDTLSIRVIPYEDIIKKLCGGKTKQNCSFCGVKVVVTELFEILTSYKVPSSNIKKGSSCVLFNALSLGKYSCGRLECFLKAASRQNDYFKLTLAVTTAANERKELRCDFCFQLCPIEKAHRCCNCLTVVYCSKFCHKEDKEKHSRKYCIEDERKTKEDRSMRRQMGEMVLEDMAGMTDDMNEDCSTRATVIEVLEAFQFDNKKRAGDNTDTEREHETRFPADETVPTADDDRSKAGTEHSNDKQTSEARDASEHRSKNESDKTLK